MKTLKNMEIEDEPSRRKEKVMNSRGSGVSKDTVMAMARSGEVEEDKREETSMSGNEEREEESNNGIAGENVLAGHENDGEVKKRKKEKRVHMKLFDDMETNVEKKKKKKKGRDNVVGTGIEGRKVERKKEMLKDDMKANDDKEKDGCEGGNAGTEKESKDGVNGEGAKVKRKEAAGDVMRSAREERELQEKRMENDREIKKKKRDHMKLPNGKETVESKKKKKKEKNDVQVPGIEGKEVERKREMPKDDTNAHNKEKKRKRKMKEIEDVVFTENEANSEVLKSKRRKRDSSKLVTPESNKSREVRFSEEVKDLPPFEDGGLVQGKRFSKVEDELIKKAVDRYIEAKQLGEKGLDMILDRKSHPQVKDCWKVISAALPWRPYSSVYDRARKLYIRGDSNWTAEEVEFVRDFYKKYGPKWKMMADELGKYRIHVRNAFQRYKLIDLNKGKWSQDEYRRLFELVNEDLLIKVSEEKKSRHGMLRDNIHWEAIGDELGTRDNLTCCHKWYKQLTSPMVAEGEWADVDDYRMVSVLVDLDASCEEEVDWENLLGHRSGDLCRKRWLQMSRHLGEHGNKSFPEQVDVLSKRYCPDFAEVREALDARPVVD